MKISPSNKPLIKILAVEDLKNDSIVANIKKELSPHILFAKKEQPKIRKLEEINLKEVKVETVEETGSKEKKRPSRAKKLSVERMKRFLSMSRESLPPPEKKKYACERDISLLKFPADTLRCPSCGILYLRRKYTEHISQCKKQPPKVKFGCTTCSFTNTSIAEVQNHIKTLHRT